MLNLSLGRIWVTLLATAIAIGLLLLLLLTAQRLQIVSVPLLANISLDRTDIGVWADLFAGIVTPVAVVITAISVGLQREDLKIQTDAVKEQASAQTNQVKISQQQADNLQKQAAETKQQSKLLQEQVSMMQQQLEQIQIQNSFVRAHQEQAHRDELWAEAQHLVALFRSLVPVLKAGDDDSFLQYLVEQKGGQETKPSVRATFNYACPEHGAKFDSDFVFLTRSARAMEKSFITKLKRLSSELTEKRVRVYLPKEIYYEERIQTMRSVLDRIHEIARTPPLGGSSDDRETALHKYQIALLSGNQFKAWAEILDEVIQFHRAVKTTQSAGKFSPVVSEDGSLDGLNAM